MEAEGPPRSASTPTTALEELHIFPTSLMKNRGIPASELEAAETEDPAWKWAEEDDDVFGAQQRDLSNLSTTEETPPVFQEDSLGSLELDYGDIVTAESGVQRPSWLASQGPQEGHVPFIPTESSVSPTLVTSLGIEPIPNEISSNIEVESWTEFPNTLKETERSRASETVEKGIILPSSTEARSCSPPEEPNSPVSHAGRRASQQEGEPQAQEKKENGGQEGLLHQRQEEGRDLGKQKKQEQRELEGQGELEWIDGLSRKQELEGVTYVQGQMGEPGQEDKGQDELVLGKQKERETFNREVEDQKQREGYPGDTDVEMQGHGEVGEEKNQGNGLAEEQRKADHYDKDQELDGKQGKIVDEGKEKQGAVEEQWKLEGSKEEQESVAGETLEVAGIVRRNENEEIQKHYGSFPLTQVVPGANISWGSFPEDLVSTITRSETQEGIKTESSRVQVSMYSSCPDSTPKSGQGSSESVQSFPPHSLSGKDTEKEAEQNGWEEEYGQGDRAMPGLGKKPTPPRPIAIAPRTETSTPFGSTKVDPNTTTSSSSCPSTFFPIGDSSLPSHLPEFSRSFSSDKEFSFHHWDPDAALNILHIPSAKEAPLVPHASSDWASTLSLPESSEETLQYHMSNSAPSSYGGGQPQYLAQPPASFYRSELSQRLSEPAIHHAEIPGREEQPRLEPFSDSSSLSQLQGFTPYLERPGATHNQTWCPPKKEAFISGGLIHGSPTSSSMVEMGLHELLPPVPVRERHSHPPLAARHSNHLNKPSAPKRYSHPPTLALASILPDSPERPSLPVKARQNRPLPSTPVTDTSHHTQTPRLRYNKPLPPTPVTPPPYQPPISTTPSKKNKPLPPVPISDPDTKPPPLPPKAKWRSNSTHRTLVDVGDQLRSKPGSSKVPGGNWEAPSPLSAGRTSWPPAVDRPTDTLTFPGRNKSEMSAPLAFSNMTNFLLLSPSSPAPSMTQDPQLSILGGVQDEHGQSEGTLRTLSRGVLQGDGNGPRRSNRGLGRQSGKPSHPPLEKSSSWPHRKDPGKFLEMSGGHSESPAEEQNKTKGWNRQGLRRPSVLPGEALDREGPPMEKPPCPSDTIVLREKKPREVMGSVARRCSKFINSSHLLYQEYSDVALNKEIQSQQRLDSLIEVSSPASPRQPRKSPGTPDSYLQRLSIASSASLWQDIPRVRNSTMLLSMTHENQKLQEAKFELIMSEASYLRSLHVAVDHFQLSSQLRATMSNQEHQWLFSRLQEVRDVSTTFLSDLEENFEHDIFTFHVCDVVLTHAPAFRRVYLPYVTNQTYQERTFQGLLNSNSNFREVLEKLESDPICQRLSLKSFLILPFQRITRLKLLLQNILKRTQPGSPEEAEATEAHHVLEELIRDCNSNVQSMRRTEELIYLSQKIEFECKIFPLISQSRWLVKSGELTALESSVSPGLRRKLATRPVHLHLFNDCLLLSRPREGNRFLVFDHAPFSSVRGEKCEMKLHGPHKNLFRLFLRNNAQGTQAEFLFRTETQSEKLRWISALALPREELDLLECHDSPQVQCLRSYKPRENDELALEKADVVMVTQQSSDGWLEGMRLSDGERGWFPLSHVEFITNSDVRKRNLSEAHRVKTAKLQLVGRQR
ncbi:rho guanine nucleotide exchange factor 5 [Trichosurus vulpecula]|uniref:rho guanine nucleotide exchange factor 5 n=1 Tax=Trichosurus vulpecula TaxID=9337 RepID=UPI00186B2571|nr:rho guanine nucleotide exchange factor 5 [Trichosurus vulpecula]XP_036616825.1 rho guanine nucleotide exchange factor 5 [Trichosurus vulpecula]